MWRVSDGMFSKDYKKPDSETDKDRVDAKAAAGNGEGDSQGFRERMAARGAGRQSSTMAMLAGLDTDDAAAMPADTPTRSLINRDPVVNETASDSALPDAEQDEAQRSIAAAHDRLADSRNKASALPIAATTMASDGLGRSGGGDGGDERDGGSRLGDISQFAFAGLAVLGLAGLSVLAAESALKGQSDDGDAATDLDLADGGAGRVTPPQGDTSAVALAEASTPVNAGGVKPWFDYRGTADRLAARQVALDKAEKQEAANAAMAVDVKAASVIAESEAKRLAEEARRAANAASATDKAELEEKARIAEAEAKRLADAAAQKNAAETAERVAQEEAEAARVATLNAQKQLEADQEAARLAKVKAAAIADANAKAEAEAEAKRLAEAELKAKADAEAARIAEAEARAKADAEAKRLVELQAKEAEAARVAALQARQAAEAEAKRLAEAEAERAAQAEAKRVADLKIKEAAEAEAKRVADAAAARKADAEAKRLAALDAQNKQEARLAEARAKRDAAQTAAAKPAAAPVRAPIVFAAYDGPVPAPASSKPAKPRVSYANTTNAQTVRTYANTTVGASNGSPNAAIVRTYPVSRSAPRQLTATSPSVRSFSREGAAFQPSPRLASDFMSERVRRTQLTDYPSANLQQFEADFLSVVSAQPDGTTRTMTTPDGRPLAVTLERSISQQVAQSGRRPLDYSGSGSNTMMQVTNPQSAHQVSVLCRDIAYAFEGQERGRFAACQSPDNPSVWNMARASEAVGSVNQVAYNAVTQDPAPRTIRTITPQTKTPQSVTTRVAQSETTRQVTDSYRAAPRVQPINFSLASSDAPSSKKHRYSTGLQKLQF